MTFPGKPGSGSQRVWLLGGNPDDPAYVQLGESPSVSEFGELRTAESGHRSDTEFIYDKQPLLYDDISAGTGSAVHRSDQRDVLLAVGGSGSDAVGGLRKHYHTPYTPGNGQEITMTGVLDMQNLGGSITAFLRTTVSGTTTLTEKSTDEWLVDVSDLDWSKSQIFRMSFQSLKVGRIQYYIVKDGIIIKVASVDNDNVRNSGYWQYPSLPPYYKIYNDGVNTIAEIGYGDELNGIGFRFTYSGTQATATALAICESVKSQGGRHLQQLPGLPFTVFNQPGVPKTVSTTLIPVLSFRVAATFNSFANRALYLPRTYSIFTDNPLHYRLVYRPVLTDPSWVAADAIPYTGLEYDVSATALSGGYIIESDYIGAGNNQRVREDDVLGRVIMSLGYGSASDILTLAAVRTGNDADVSATISGKMIR